MRNNFLIPLFLGTLVLGATSVAFGTVIDFTGGTVTHWDASTGTTNNSAVFQSVDYYTEGGFKLAFIDPVPVHIAFSSIVGDYYGARNDVIHGHWATGVPKYGDLTGIEITKVGGGTFDLNYFILTSNTDTGGAAASGREQTWIHAWLLGVNTYSQMLPPDNWGFSGLNPQIFLGSQFNLVDKVSFTVTNTVDCFGMDEFYINEPAPPVIPEPSTLIIWSLLASLGIGLAWWRRRRAV